MGDDALIRGETIEVWQYVESGVDSFNNPVKSWAIESIVENVLVDPGNAEDLSGALRQDGDENHITLYFPKKYTSSLRGHRVKVRGLEYAIEGDPIAYQVENTPTDWNRKTTATRVEG